MKKKLNKKILLPLFLLSLSLCIFSLIQGTRAALIKSQDYEAQFEMYHIGITLNENGEKVGQRDYKNGEWTTYTASLLEGRDTVRYGEVYPETLSITNSGEIDEYVRFTVYKYWLDEKEAKRYDLDTSYIHLNFSKSENWIHDEKASTDEREIFYYKKPLSKGETTDDLLESFYLDKDIKVTVEETSTVDKDGYTVIHLTYLYDGKTFCLDAEADAVQTHNAKDAILSAWGRSVTIDKEGNLALGKEGN